MIEKVWQGREVRVVEVDAYLHVRTVAVMDAAYHTGGFDASYVADADAAKRIAGRIARVRRAENAIAHVFGHGRVLTVAPRRVRMALRKAYGETDNVDTGHYGAMRGLDFAKGHKAVITVGRHEFPTWIVDALAAALTYDDDQPEEPCDVAGNGLDPRTGEPRGVHTVERTYRLRDGRDLKMEVSEMPGRWGKAVQRQFREEEQLQAMGRLRPVYREGEPPVWIAFSRVLPEGTIIDAITSLRKISDMKGAGRLFEAVRRAGVLDPEILPRDLRGALGYAATANDLGLSSTGEEQSPFAAGLNRYAVDVDGTERQVLVPAYHEAPVSAVAEAYDALGKSVRGVRLVAQGTSPEPSQRKALDKIDAEIGSRNERAEHERVARAEVVERRRKQIAANPMLAPLKEGVASLERVEEVDLSVEVILATQAISLPLDEEASEADDPSELQPVRPVPRFAARVQPRRRAPAPTARPATAARPPVPAPISPGGAALVGLRGLASAASVPEELEPA